MSSNSRSLAVSTMRSLPKDTNYGFWLRTAICRRMSTTPDLSWVKRWALSCDSHLYYWLGKLAETLLLATRPRNSRLATDAYFKYNREFLLQMVFSQFFLGNCHWTWRIQKWGKTPGPTWSQNQKTGILETQVWLFLLVVSSPFRLTRLKFWHKFCAVLILSVVWRRYKKSK